MRILIVSTLPPLRDGLAEYAAGITERFAGRGDEVAWVGTAETDSPRALGSLRRPLRALLRARRWRPDHVVVEHTVATYGVLLPALWLLVLGLRLSGVRVVLTHHEVTRDVGRLGRPGLAYYAVVSRLGHLVHVHTAEAADLLVRRTRLARGRVLVHPHPIFPPVAGAPAERLVERHRLQGRLVLLQFGFVQVEKGLRETVLALAELRRTRPELAERAVLVVAGAVRERPAGFGRFERADHDYLAEVRRSVDELGLADQVVFTGSVPAEEVTSWFRLADLVLLPYERTEQSGVANLAVATDAPVLSTRQGGLVALFGDLPSIADTAPEPFAAALAEALADLPTRRELCAERYAALRAGADPALLVERIERGAA